MNQEGAQSESAATTTDFASVLSADSEIPAKKIKIDSSNDVINGNKISVATNNSSSTTKNDNNNTISEEKDDDKNGQKQQEKASTSCCSKDGVVKHYNHVPETGLEIRTQSRIFYLRNFNNWIKSVLIGDALSRIRDDLENSGRIGEPLNVLDLCCGKGGDLLKWKIGSISHLVCADVADVSLDQCKNRYTEMVERNKKERRPRPLFSCEFFNADLTEVLLKEKFADRNSKFNLCSCQFALHYSFSDEASAKRMLQNACESLKPGGYFIGTIPNAEQLIYLAGKNEKCTFENEVCSIELKFDTTEPSKIPLFGAKYHFTLGEVVDLPEYLIYFPLLIKLLEQFDMELVYFKSFPKILEEKVYREKPLLSRMQGLEPYPAAEGCELMGKDENQYSHAAEKVKELETNSDFKEKCLATLSKAEWDVASLYSAFMFKKKI